MNLVSRISISLFFPIICGPSLIMLSSYHLCSSLRPLWRTQDASRRNEASVGAKQSAYSIAVSTGEWTDNLTYPLWTSLVDDRQLRFAAVEPPLVILIIPYQISPKLPIRILSHHRIDRLDQWVPTAVLGRRRLPIVFTHFCKTYKPAWLDVLFYGAIGLTSSFARL